MNRMQDRLLKTVLYLNSRKIIRQYNQPRHHFNNKIFSNKFLLKKFNILNKNINNQV